MYSKANWQNLKQALDNLSVKGVRMYEDGADVHQLWSLFHSELSKEINRFIPHKLCRRTAALPSLNKHRGQLLRRKANLYKMAKSNGNWDAYRQIQRHCKKMMRHVEWDHINNIILEGLQSNNTKPFWRYVKANDTITSELLHWKRMAYSTVSVKKRYIFSWTSLILPSQHTASLLTLYLRWRRHANPPFPMLR